MKKLLACGAISLGLLLPTGAASAGPIAGVKECPDGSVGVVVYKTYYSTGGEYDLVSVCVPLKP